jgi:hypothetical protein
MSHFWLLRQLHVASASVAGGFALNFPAQETILERDFSDFLPLSPADHHSTT